MSANQDLAKLKAELKRFAKANPGKKGILRITRTTFLSATKKAWEAQGWTVTQEVAKAIMNGDDGERKSALLSVLQGQGISGVQFVKGTDVLEIVP